ncbi:MAG: hypothetical protein ACXIUD_07005 [Mongoliitalea sp.]
MYTTHFQGPINPHWVIADDDPANKYIELLGYKGEYLISISYEPDENPQNPHFLNFQQMKGAFQRYDYTAFGVECWYASPRSAVLAAMELMELVAQSYPKFSPISHELYVALGPVADFERIQRELGGVLLISSVSGQELVCKQVQFMPQDTDLMVTAKKIIQSYTSLFQLVETDFIGGLLCNENGQYLGRLDYNGQVISEEIHTNI